MRINPALIIPVAFIAWLCWPSADQAIEEAPPPPAVTSTQAP